MDRTKIKLSETQKHMQKTKLHYQAIEIPNLDAAPEHVDTEILPPTQPNKTVIPIPSKQILPNQDYKNYKKNKQFQYNESGSLIINPHNLKLLCIKEGLYQFPELNTKLYLHFKCIQKIQNLYQYKNLKTLYLQNNVIKKIENLQCLPLLQNLFLQHNMIGKIENLEGNKNLLVINLSYNNIFVLEGLSELQQLQNLTITNNYFEKFQSVAHLGECSPTLTSIDLSYNRIVADQRLFDLVPQIKCIYLSGNPLVRQIQHYRRTVIGKLKNLLYLDQRAVGEDERYLAQMWMQHGEQGLKKAKSQIQIKKQARKQQQKKHIMKDINTHRSKKLIMFKKSIKQLQEQIQKLQQYQADPSNADMQYYYTSQIQEKENKIREFQDFVENITCRIQGREPPKPKYQPVQESKQDMLRLTIEQKEQEKGQQKIQEKGQEKGEHKQYEKQLQIPGLESAQLDTNSKEQIKSQNTQAGIVQQISKTEAAGLSTTEQQSDENSQIISEKSNKKSGVILAKTNYSYDELD